MGGIGKHVDESHTHCCAAHDCLAQGFGEGAGRERGEGEEENGGFFSRRCVCEQPVKIDTKGLHGKKRRRKENHKQELI